MKKILVIDPGTRKTGWALFTAYDTKKAFYVRSGVFEASKSNNWLIRLDRMREAFRKLLVKEEPSLVLIEQPMTFMTSRKGLGALNSGAVMKLMALVFTFRTMALCRKIDTVLVPVQTWKGQVPKRVTQKRIKRHLGLVLKDDNEADAAGIGLWYIRKVLKYSIM